MPKQQQVTRDGPAPTPAAPAASTRGTSRQDRFGNAFLAAQLGGPQAAAEGSGREGRTVSREVSETVRETISGAPAPFGAWNGQFSWESKFQLVIAPRAGTLTIVVRIHTDADAATREKWERAIESKWGGKYALSVAGTDGAPAQRYTIGCDLQWVEERDDAHFNVDANRAGETADGRAGLGGTTSMTGWGVDDDVDVTHEFGHMLGAVEDYFHTNGEDHTHGGTRQGYRDTDGGIMNNPADDPFAEHYELVRRHAAKALRVPESRCTITS